MIASLMHVMYEETRQKMMPLLRCRSVATAPAPAPLPPPPLPPQHRCSHCDANFTQLAVYRDHLASVHIDMLFHCQECDQYEERDNLISHMARHVKEYTKAEAGETQTNITRAKAKGSSSLSGKDQRSTTSNGRKDVNTCNSVPGTISIKGCIMKKEVLEPHIVIDTIKTENSSLKVERSIKESKTENSDGRFAFTDSDSSDGFGQLPDSVFEAIEDTREAPDEGVDTAKKRSRSGKQWPRTCNVCQKEFTVSSSYFYHVKYVHSDRTDWRHGCDTCGRRFPSRAALRDHETVHTGKRPHACTQCPKSFRSKAGLYIHIQDVHSILEKQYVCAECNKSFRWKQKLIMHFKRHRREKSHVCLQCGRGFSARCDLTRHMRTHSTSKPHCCTVCDARFAQRRYLQHHMIKKHNVTTLDKVV